MRNIIEILQRRESLARNGIYRSHVGKQMMRLGIDRPFEYTDNRLSNLYRELRSEGVK